MKEMLSDIEWGMETEFFRFADLIGSKRIY